MKEGKDSDGYKEERNVSCPENMRGTKEVGERRGQTVIKTQQREERVDVKENVKFMRGKKHRICTQNGMLLNPQNVKATIEHEEVRREVVIKTEGATKRLKLKSEISTQPINDSVNVDGGRIERGEIEVKLKHDKRV